MKRTAFFTSSMHINIRYHVYEPQVVIRVKGIVQIHHGLGENYHVTDKKEYEEIHAELIDSVGDCCHDCFHELPF